MQKVRDLIDLPIIDIVSGRELGQVRDILFDRHFRFQGLLLEYAGWLREGNYIPSDAVRFIGTDCIFVRDADCILPYQRSTAYFFPLSDGPSHLRGKPVISSDGYQLGQLEDVYFQDQLETITGYEVSDGFWADITEGRKIVQTNESLRVGKDALMVLGSISCSLSESPFGPQQSVPDEDARINQ